MDIEYYTDDCTYRLRDRRLLRLWLRRVASEEGGNTIGHINYVFCSARRLLEMNRQYLGHDYYTDIITFDDSDLAAHTVSGDIFIDVETVADNARLYGATPEDEMRRVVVHGVLHLCGQKDKAPEDNRTMHAKEDRYLELLRQMREEENARRAERRE